MEKIASVRTADHFERFIKEQTASSRYASADEVVEAGLKPLKDHEANGDRLPDEMDFGPAPVWTPEELREAIRTGEESGPGGPLDVDRFFAEVEAELAGRRNPAP